MLDTDLGADGVFPTVLHGGLPGIFGGVVALTGVVLLLLLKNKNIYYSVDPSEDLKIIIYFHLESNPLLTITHRSIRSVMGLFRILFAQGSVLALVCLQIGPKISSRSQSDGSWHGTRSMSRYWGHRTEVAPSIVRSRGSQARRDRYQHHRSSQELWGNIHFSGN